MTYEEQSDGYGVIKWYLRADIVDLSAREQCDACPFFGYEM